MPHEVTKLQLILQVNEHKSILLDEKPKLILMEGNTI